MPSGCSGIPSVTVVVPTRSRPADLCRAIASVIAQTRAPDELIIVDQSPERSSRRDVERILGLQRTIRLVYVHDPSIAGLVAAKQLAADRAHADIVCFLEDDVVLEPGFLAAILDGFATDARMMGCCGVITNQPNLSPTYVLLHGLFFRGIFSDPRPDALLKRHTETGFMTRCDVLWGGLSAWRREVFSAVRFDVKNGFHMLEDVEFSTRVVRKLGHCLFINHTARLAHYFSPVNRDAHGERQRRKLREALVFYKKRRGWNGATSGLIMALIWWLAEAIMQSARSTSVRPLAGYLHGLREGLQRRPVEDDRDVLQPRLMNSTDS